MGEVDWEKRAREAVSVEEVLKIGAEMADARASEIAKACEDHVDPLLGRVFAAALARSFISKSDTVKSIDDAIAYGYPAGEDLRKGDAVELRDGKWWRAISRPKTREAALEDALREIAERDVLIHGSVVEIARRALEWRPEP